jgi:hypothetical protein
MASEKQEISNGRMLNAVFSVDDSTAYKLEEFLSEWQAKTRDRRR